MQVYLAGPMSGLTFEEANAWRVEFASDLRSNGVRCFSPLRGKTNNAFGPHADPNNPICSESGILNRDFNDVRSSDLVVANLLGAKAVSIGTVAEIAWCHALQKPCVVVMEENHNPHDHVFVNRISTYRVSSLSEALNLVRLFFDIVA